MRSPSRKWPHCSGVRMGPLDVAEICFRNAKAERLDGDWKTLTAGNLNTALDFSRTDSS